jgi:hypothetical protein
MRSKLVGSRFALPCGLALTLLAGGCVGETDSETGGDESAELVGESADALSWGGLGTMVSGPGVASRGPGMLDLFARGNDNVLYHRHWNNGTNIWYDWGPLGGDIRSDPAAVARGNGNLEVFARGSDNALWHRFWNPGAVTWSNWESLGGVLASGPAVSSMGLNRMDVFVRGSDNALWSRAWTGVNWEPCYSLGGHPAGANRFGLRLSGSAPRLRPASSSRSVPAGALARIFAGVRLPGRQRGALGPRRSPDAGHDVAAPFLFERHVRSAAGDPPEQDAASAQRGRTPPVPPRVAFAPRPRRGGRAGGHCAARPPGAAAWVCKQPLVLRVC